MSNTTREVFKNNLKKYRLAGKQSGLKHCKSAKTFSEYINVNYNTYIDYERKGNSPPLNILITIAAALCVSIDELLEYKPPMLNIAKFLSDLGVKFNVEKRDDDSFYILYAPIASLSSISVDCSILEEIIQEFQSLDVTVTNKELKGYIFYKFANEYDELRYNDLHETALHRNIVLPYVKAWCDDLKKLEAIRETGNFEAYFLFLEKMFDRQKKLKKNDMLTWYYGFKDFRGGKK